MLMVNRLDNGTIPQLTEPAQAQNAPPVDACPDQGGGPSA
jgi:hypothetical protein